MSLVPNLWSRTLLWIFDRDKAFPRFSRKVLIRKSQTPYLLLNSKIQEKKLLHVAWLHRRLVALQAIYFSTHKVSLGLFFSSIQFYSLIFIVQQKSSQIRGTICGMQIRLAQCHKFHLYFIMELRLSFIQYVVFEFDVGVYFQAPNTKTKCT